MSRCDGTRLVGDASSMRGSPTRRRLLALLSSLPIIAMQSEGAEQRRASQADPVSNADPVPRLFAVFQAFLDRHAAAIATRDGIEAALVDRIGWPRVALLGGSDSEPRYPAELAEIARAMPPGRRRQRLEQRLRRRQRRWDEAAATVVSVMPSSCSLCACNLAAQGKRGVKAEISNVSAGADPA